MDQKNYFYKQLSNIALSMQKTTHTSGVQGFSVNSMNKDGAILPSSRDDVTVGGRKNKNRKKDLSALIVKNGSTRKRSFSSTLFFGSDANDDASDGDDDGDSDDDEDSEKTILISNYRDQSTNSDQQLCAQQQLWCQVQSSWPAMQRIASTRAVAAQYIDVPKQVKQRKTSIAPGAGSLFGGDEYDRDEIFSAPDPLDYSTITTTASLRQQGQAEAKKSVAECVNVNPDRVRNVSSVQTTPGLKLTNYKKK
jgi:hypothetical protein